MLAAGNRVIIKPSELSPAFGKQLKAMISATFPSDLVYVAVGGRELAKMFSTLRWDHLLYTGSTTIGRTIMTEAAKNLIPVTLELGGKCPAIFSDADSVNEKYVNRVIGTKQVKSGQMVC
jgi:coniferyl-aldehyde dehydrogenase